MSFALIVGGLISSARDPRGAVSVAHGAESATIMWSVFFVFLSYLDRDLVKADVLNRSVDGEKENKETFFSLNGTFCARMLTDGGNFLYQVSDGVEVVQSVVSPSGIVVNCSVLVNQIQVKSFMKECKLGLKMQKAAQQLDARFGHLDEAKVMCRELKEKSKRRSRTQRDDSDDPEKVLQRSKRGFTYPGTLWCGAGNTADHYDQLGKWHLSGQDADQLSASFSCSLIFPVQENLRRLTTAAGSTTTVLT